jgi:hypothetical protein
LLRYHRSLIIFSSPTRILLSLVYGYGYYQRIIEDPEFCFHGRHFIFQQTKEKDEDADIAGGDDGDHDQDGLDGLDMGDGSMIRHSIADGGDAGDTGDASGLALEPIIADSKELVDAASASFKAESAVSEDPKPKPEGLAMPAPIEKKEDFDLMKLDEEPKLDFGAAHELKLDFGAAHEPKHEQPFISSAVPFGTHTGVPLVADAMDVDADEKADVEKTEDPMETDGAKADQMGTEPATGDAAAAGDPLAIPPVSKLVATRERENPQIDSDVNRADVNHALFAF